ncbi:MAG: hypothetical protein NVS4B11_04900 [Ktedonobacteraceae bacterium]
MKGVAIAIMETAMEAMTDMVMGTAMVVDVMVIVVGVIVVLAETVEGTAATMTDGTTTGK